MLLLFTTVKLEYLCLLSVCIHILHACINYTRYVNKRNTLIYIKRRINHKCNWNILNKLQIRVEESVFVLAILRCVLEWTTGRALAFRTVDIFVYKVWYLSVRSNVWRYDYTPIIWRTADQQEEKLFRFYMGTNAK